jgi:hypothetical protein
LAGRNPDRVVQSLFTAGPAGNCTRDGVSSRLDCVGRLSPLYVQLYTLDRTAPSKAIIPVGHSWLVKLRARLNERGVRAEVF